MRIALVNSVAGYGSTGRIVSQLAHLPGTAARIYYGRKKDLSDADTFRMNGFTGNAVHALKTYLSDAQGFANAKETERMIADLRAFSPDLIHLHNLHGYYLNVEVLFAYLKESGIPVIWTMHDCWAFTGHCAHYESVHCTKWKDGCHDCAALRHYPVTFNGRHVAENYERKKRVFTSLPYEQMTIVTPSLWLKDQLAESFLKDYHVIRIANGIDLSRFRAHERQDDGVFHILAVAGNWYEEKGYTDLKLIAERLEEGQELTVVGVNRRQKTEMESYDRVRAVEHTDSVDELAGLYSAADVLLNPTYEDTFPTVNIEAQACGCPVITYETGGSPEMLNTKTGIVVERGNVNAMWQAIRDLQNGTIIMDRDAAAENAAYYTTDMMLAEYAELYRRMIGHE